MTELEKFIEEMKQKYGDSVIIQQGACNEETLAQIPEPLRELYLSYDGLEFPFGNIDSAETALKHSNEAEPFKSEHWFCFGFDGYFSFWLCNYMPDDEGLWITPWDHEADCERECVYTTLIQFLRDAEKDYAENEEEEKQFF